MNLSKLELSPAPPQVVNQFVTYTPNLEKPDMLEKVVLYVCVDVTFQTQMSLSSIISAMQNKESVKNVL